MLKVKEILMNKIALDIECIDRVNMNGYVKHLQLPGGLITFIREQMGFPIPSSSEKTILNRINELRKQFGPQIVPYRKVRKTKV